MGEDGTGDLATQYIGKEGAVLLAYAGGNGDEGNGHNDELGTLDDEGHVPIEQQRVIKNEGTDEVLDTYGNAYEGDVEHETQFRMHME